MNGLKSPRKTISSSPYLVRGHKFLIIQAHFFGTLKHLIRVITGRDTIYITTTKTINDTNITTDVTTDTTVDVNINTSTTTNLNIYMTRELRIVMTW